MLATLALLLTLHPPAHDLARFTVYDARYVLTTPYADKSGCNLPPLWSASDRALCRLLSNP